MEKRLFGAVGKKAVYAYTLSNGNVSAEILTYGGIIRSLTVKDKDGNDVDVVLGYNTIEEYIKNDGYLGAAIGRVCNRTEKGKFKIGDKEYSVGINDGENSLHGGVHGFNSKVFDAIPVGETLILRYTSLDGEEGYPSTLFLSITYSITQENGLKIEYEAHSLGDTVVNFTNHSYFNLDGEGKGDILHNKVYVNADKITPVDEKLIPHGEFKEVKGTAFDFNELKEFGKDIGADDEQLKICGGYDINYVLSGEGFRKVACAVSEKTGIMMEVLTTLPGMQLYSGNFLTEREGKSGKIGRRYGFCMETQNFPNAVNCPNYPSPVLKKGEKYYSATEYRFTK